MAQSVVLSLGSNLGDRIAALNTMRCALAQLFCGSLRCSAIMETQPLGVAQGHPWYLNQIVAGECTLEPLHLLDWCQQLEKVLGRTGKGLLLARTADLDILYYGTLVRETPQLQLPHPRILARRFCLEGLAQVDPMRMVEKNMTAAQILKRDALLYEGQDIRVFHDRKRAV